MINDTDDQAQPALWGLPETEHVATPARRMARIGPRPVPPESDGEVGELWTIDQVADYLGVPKQTIYGWLTTGYGPSRGRTTPGWGADGS